MPGLDSRPSATDDNIRCPFCDARLAGDGEPKNARLTLRSHIVLHHRPTRIECAALLTEADEVISLPRPARHHDVVLHMVKSGYTEEQIARSEQGFTTDTLDFVRRPPAKRIAARAGQLLRETHPIELFSEDLW